MIQIPWILAVTVLVEACLYLLITSINKKRLDQQRATVPVHVSVCAALLICTAVFVAMTATPKTMPNAPSDLQCPSVITTFSLDDMMKCIDPGDAPF